MSNELKSIIQGTVRIAGSDFIQTTLSYLRASKKTSRTIENSEFFVKKNEVEILREFANKEQVLIHSLEKCTYLTEGAEQKVYLLDDGKFVIKTNDTIFYEYWEDYLVSLLIHNYLFPNTAYQFIGFLDANDGFYAVVKQKFITSDEITNLTDLKEFLLNNGFTHKKNNDYFHEKMGIILEDLHDENVLTANEVFFIIDSVFYLTKPN